MIHYSFIYTHIIKHTTEYKIFSRYKITNQKNLLVRYCGLIFTTEQIAILNYC